MSVNEKMTAIADAIRNKTKESGLLSLDDIAEKIPVVYDKGFEDGKALGGDGVDWDVIQSKGNRLYYNNGFAYWGATEINPKYMIAPTSTFFVNAFKHFFNMVRISYISDYHVAGCIRKCFNLSTNLFQLNDRMIAV